MSTERSTGALTARPQPFEETYLRAPVWRITVAGTTAPDDVAALLVSAVTEGVGLMMCRLEPADPAARLLAAAKFRAVEELVTFEGPIAPATPMPPQVRPATEADIPACRRIAAGAFRFDRFHKDPAIDDRAADAIKAAWIENAIRGRADTVLVAEADGAVAGFNACLLAGEAAVIDLIGVDPGAQGRGVGKALIAGAMAHYAGRASALRAGTQADNEASQRLYRHFGMEETARHVTYHWTP